MVVLVLERVARDDDLEGVGAGPEPGRRVVAGLREEVLVAGEKSSSTFHGGAVDEQVVVPVRREAHGGFLDFAGEVEGPAGNPVGRGLRGRRPVRREGWGDPSTV